MGNISTSEKYNELIGFINDKYKAFETMLLEAERRAEKAELEARKLRERVRELEARTTRTGSAEMEDIKKSILQLLAKRPDLETEAVAARLKIRPEIAAAHLRELENQKFAYGSYSYGMIEPATWFLLEDGRKYLSARGLID